MLIDANTVHTDSALSRDALSGLTEDDAMEEETTEAALTKESLGWTPYLFYARKVGKLKFAVAMVSHGEDMATNPDDSPIRPVPHRRLLWHKACAAGKKIIAVHISNTISIPFNRFTFKSGRRVTACAPESGQPVTPLWRL